MLEKYKSRKWQLTAVGVLLLTGLPILYKKLQISDSLAMIVLGAIAGLISTYHFANVKSKSVSVENSLEVAKDYVLGKD